MPVMAILSFGTGLFRLVGERHQT
ncbi:protein of unknown function [Cyanobium sp. NIES-981]|nr:protein of unknown function [Cyanobium sp. NIES-981]